MSQHKNPKHIPEEWSERVTPIERSLVPRFASRACHLPGNGIRADWLQYMLNNHPVIGICCHHRLHPLKKRQRFIILLGSFAFGVAITNACYLWFVSTGRDSKQELFSIDLGNTQKSAHYSVTTGLVMLVTVGSGLHTLFDRFVWSVSACACCRAGGTFESDSVNSPRRGRCQDVGSYVVVFLVALVVAAATLIVVVRAKMDYEGQTSIPYIQDKNSTLSEIFDVNDFELEDFSFLKAYCIEFAVSLFLYYPFLETVLFSGILGCYRLPVLGGRPYEIKKEMKKSCGTSSARRVSALEMA